LKLIEADTHSSIIADKVWENAKQKTFSAYVNSSSVYYLKKCIQLFEDTYKAKYLTDFKEFVFESSIEDFCDVENADVVVSTIHKSKGMAFDDVYFLISEPRHITDDVLRRYYVGITRAKQRLFVHTNSSVFDVFNAVQKNIDHNQYEMPNDIVLQLSHKDVNLGFFKSKKKEILALRAGQCLLFDNNYLLPNTSNTPICQLSHKMQEELCLWYEKGYVISSASIRFIVAWKPKDAPKEEKEHAVMLIDLAMSKKSNIQGTT
jgi:ATP-dependent DNA helicase RecQ